MSYSSREMNNLDRVKTPTRSKRADKNKHKPADTDIAPEELLIRRVQYCQALTKRGKRCACVIKIGKEYCDRHAKLFKYSKPEECPICNENLADTPQPLSCGHWVHRACLLKWRDICPICRSKVSLTKKERLILAETKTNNDDTVLLTEDAIAELLRRDLVEGGFGLDDEIIYTLDLEEDMDLLSRLVVEHVVNNLTSMINNTLITPV